jgi:hypothetical protein
MPRRAGDRGPTGPSERAINAASAWYVLAAATLIAQEASPVAMLGALGASVVIGIGVMLGRHADSAGRERAWELEAVGVGFLAAAWLAGTTLGQ